MIKIDLKKFLVKTRDFILIVGFIIIFKSIFGNENTLIGVTTITAMLMLLGRDLTLEPVKNTLGLIIFNVALGVFAYISHTSIYLGIVVNFIAIFTTAFSLSYNLKTPTYVAFTLQYLFMLATPVTIDRLGVRLTSLIIGAIFIMTIQMVVNRNRLTKNGNVILSEVCTLLLNKIRYINRGLDTSKIESQIISSLYSFQKIVYDKRKRNFYLTEEGRIKLNIALSLNKLNLLLDELKHEEDFNRIQESIVIAIDNTKMCFNSKENLKRMNKLFNKEERYLDGIENITVLKVFDVIKFIKKSLFELYGLDSKEYNGTSYNNKIPKKFSKFKLYSNEIKADSIRFTFAFRFAIGVVIGAFITDYFNIPEGRWIYFTIAALSQPQYEMSKQKGKDRLFATTIGIGIVSILFFIVTNQTLRGLIIIGAGYIGSYLKQYKYNMICVTVSAVGSAALMGNMATEFSLDRIVYVIIGTVIALFLARFVLPYRLKDANNNLIRRYRGSLLEMLNEIESALQGNRNDNSIRNLVLATSLIEDKLITNNSTSKNRELDFYIEEGRRVSLNIFELYEWIKENKIDKENINSVICDIIEEIDLLSKGKTLSREELIKRLGETHETKDRVTISSLIEIFSGLDRMGKINVEF